MTAALHQRVLAYLGEHRVMTLATQGRDGPWAAAVFYASEGFDLYFLSSPSTRHCADLSANPRRSDDPGGLRGLVADPRRAARRRCPAAGRRRSRPRPRTLRGEVPDRRQAGAGACSDRRSVREDRLVPRRPGAALLRRQLGALRPPRPGHSGPAWLRPGNGSISMAPSRRASPTSGATACSASQSSGHG
ncbi:MAG: pyridoxamine 5'-phosphate oxidase family protein [Burkholderiaceae bacterium]|nr:pyridoxamine 5'-phosphate oxidase family protein [Burkholderiaceae bacterium]